jgi:hypothetical protein
MMSARIKSIFAKRHAGRVRIDVSKRGTRANQNGNSI